MNSFLSGVASAYYQNFKNDISKFVFVFPNQRAGMFFQNELTKLIEQPLFSPEIITVDACFRRFTDIKPADRTDLLFKLYKQFSSLGNNESFDSFVYWGDMLINDFNEIDKYLADAKQVFSNISDIKQIDDTYSYLSENQRAIIESFWDIIIRSSEYDTSKNFSSLWNILYQLYENFRNELLKDKIGYEGMINRQAIYNIRNNSYPISEHYVFIGFNALNNCERELFNTLNKLGYADFYWDYDSEEYLSSDNIAFSFKNSNISNYPSKFKIKTDYLSYNSKNFTLYQIPSAVGQAKIIYSILNNIQLNTQNNSFINTAVVLSDERLLVPIIHSIPESVKRINVTMGYPLSFSSVSSFIDLYFNLYKKTRIKSDKALYYHKEVIHILNHPLIVNIDKNYSQTIQKEIVYKNLIYINPEIFEKSKFLTLLFRHNNDHIAFIDNLLSIIKQIQYYIGNNAESENEKKSQSLDITFLFQYYTTITRFKTLLLDNSDVEFNKIETLVLLLKQLTSTISVPFIGEPLQGLQIMGVLEARGIDFENIILSSFNEGVYPQNNSTNSFLPYTIRKGFGLPTAEYHDAVTAYNFYNLINRAQNIYFLADSRSDNGNSSEISRFYYQLKYLYHIDINTKQISQDFKINESISIEIRKNQEICNKLKLYTLDYPNGKTFSASGLNTYIDCPLKFYYQYIEGIREEDEITELIEFDHFGTIFHKSMEILYQPFIGRIVDSEALNFLLKNKLGIERAILKAYNVEYFKNETDDLIELEGNNILICSILIKYITQLIKMDKNITPFKLISVEEKVATKIDTKFGSVNLFGVIDRVHEKDNTFVVLDYKTGSGSLEFKDFADSFDSLNLKRPKYVLQTMFYGFLYKHKSSDKPISPGIFYLKDSFKDGFGTSLIQKQEKNNSKIIDDYITYADDFEPGLIKCLEDILNPEINFTQCKDTKPCSYCDFNSICQR